MIRMALAHTDRSKDTYKNDFHQPTTMYLEVIIVSTKFVTI